MRKSLAIVCVLWTACAFARADVRLPHIFGDHMVLQRDKPVAVRYAWSNLPLGTLMNFRQLPAYPFRTDDWPLVPHQSTGAYEVKGK